MTGSSVGVFVSHVEPTGQASQNGLKVSRRRCWLMEVRAVSISCRSKRAIRLELERRLIGSKSDKNNELVMRAGGRQIECMIFLFRSFVRPFVRSTAS